MSGLRKFLWAFGMISRSHSKRSCGQVFIGFVVKGASVRPSFFYVAYLICCAGVNGSSTHAVKALAGALAVRDGYGRGEFSYATN